MGLAVIPDDWTDEYIELCVKWPNSPDWRAILRGLLTSPYDETFWDAFTGTTTDPQAAILATFSQNLHLEECTMMPVGTILTYVGESAPTGFFICDGSEFDRSDFADLFDLIGERYGNGNGTTTANLPNFGGRVPVGFDVTDADFNDLENFGGQKSVTLEVSEIPSHNHTQDSHNHTQSSHNHTQDAHNHSQNPHNHTQNPHAHTVDGLVNALTGSARRTLASVNTGDNNIVSRDATATNIQTSASNISTAAVNQAATAVNQATTAANQNTGGGDAHNNLQPYLIVNYIIKY